MIIAELGIGHRGDMGRAKELIRLAKENGASMVKSQLYSAEDDRDKPYYQESLAAELTYDKAKMLFDYAESIGIETFYSVFGERYVEWCELINVKRYKIACNMRDSATIQAVLATGKPVIVSMPEFPNWSEDKPQTPTWLYCVAEYPANLEYMPDFENEPLFTGFSDHCIGIDYARIAIARGAKIIEKHFCTDLEDGQVDSRWSMDVRMLRDLVAWEKTCQQVLG